MTSSRAARCHFEAADAQEFTTEKTFGAFVFEWPGISRIPVRSLARYAQRLREGGVISLSMYDMLPARAMWTSMNRRFKTLDAVQIKSSIHTWNVRLLAKRT